MSTSLPPSEPARGPHDEPKVIPPAPPLYKPAAVALVIAAMPWVIVAALSFMKPMMSGAPEWLFGALIVTVLASPFVALLVAGVSMKKLKAIHEHERPPGVRLAQVARGIALGTIVAGFLYSCFGMTIMRGRQLRRRGKPRLAKLVAGCASSRTSHATPRALELARVADAWRHNALTEHASVASFSHVALDLLAAGAPTSLVRLCHEAALDEVAHTEMCFEVATMLDGVVRTPAPFIEAAERPPVSKDRDALVERIAVEALIEGALLEGAAAHVAAHLARTTTHADVKRVLATIAADEKRHADHGWRVLAWCIDTSPRVLDAANAALAATPRDVDAGATLEHAEEQGIASASTLRTCYARALSETRARLAAFGAVAAAARAA